MCVLSVDTGPVPEAVEIVTCAARWEDSGAQET